MSKLPNSPRGRVKDSPIDPHKVGMEPEEQRNYDALRGLPLRSKEKFTPAESRDMATNPSKRLEPLFINTTEAKAREDQKMLGTRKSMKQLKDEVAKQRANKPPPGDIMGKGNKSKRVK